MGHGTTNIAKLGSVYLDANAMIYSVEKIVPFLHDIATALASCETRPSQYN
jgi:hypothetical protein